MNTNTPADEVPAIFRENQSYYLIGFESARGVGAGLWRRLQIKVDRPDVQVLARSGYYTR